MEGPQDLTENLQKIEVMYQDYRTKHHFEDVPEVSVEVFKKTIENIQDSEMVLVDVREEAEQQTSMIPNSISYKTFEKEYVPRITHWTKAESKKMVVVVYCTIGVRSALYAKYLLKKLPANNTQNSNADASVQILNLKGSILSWCNHGLDLVDPKTGEKTTKIHTYGQEWCILPSQLQPQWFSGLQRIYYDTKGIAYAIQNSLK